MTAIRVTEPSTGPMNRPVLRNARAGDENFMDGAQCHLQRSPPGSVP